MSYTVLGNTPGYLPESERPPLAAHQGGEMSVIDKFRGPHRFLSNFWIEPFEFDGQIVSTGEHAFQAAKCKPGDEEIRARVLTASRADGKPSPTLAKRMGKKVPLRPDWSEVRIDVMREVLAAKFAPGSPLAEQLLATGEAELIEGNTWRDTFWGRTRDNDGNWAGQNWLGVLLMERREQLRGD